VTKTKLADHCRKVVAEGPDTEKPFAASVLVSNAVGWAGLTDAERKKLFLSEQQSVWRWAALALAKNECRRELIEWAAERPADDHLDVVWVLLHDPPKVWPKAELKFCLAVARLKPGSVTCKLNLLDRPVPIVFREPILAYLKREIEKPTFNDINTQSASELFAALGVLDTWKSPDDVPLLLSHFKHPVRGAATRINGDERTEIRVYRLRSYLKSMLEARGVKVPSDIVYEEVIGPAKD